MMMWCLSPSLLGPHVRGSILFVLLSGYGVTRYVPILSHSYFWLRSWLNYFPNLWYTEDTFLFSRPLTYDDIFGCQNLTYFNRIFDYYIGLILIKFLISTELGILPSTPFKQSFSGIFQIISFFADIHIYIYIWF